MGNWPLLFQANAWGMLSISPTLRVKFATKTWREASCSTSAPRDPQSLKRIGGFSPLPSTPDGVLRPCVSETSLHFDRTLLPNRIVIDERGYDDEFDNVTRKRENATYPIGTARCSAPCGNAQCALSQNPAQPLE